MSTKVLIESTVKAGSMNTLTPFLAANLPNVRGFSGCLQVTVYFDSETQRMIFDEEWLTIEHHQRYINAITQNGVLHKLAHFLESPPNIKYFDRMEI
ncbi:antibiotic biosynthesis monooxygenase [Leptolyngbyaceae cyanobacterium CCMR0082]|uniref:Antibiotic biosynthesis monooxygenase n=1 Tax=Adonisia turfae CCMR0082 TaxID=2304604 RepID=A0A6M0S015_9CYAN|nr:antibiotic biosynthesis monooxygenase [Adonisia turfae]NEZ61560.1 antibiotic biosynthesis monooxygenase [Adonisia turfae CCMR0082]